MLQVFRFVYITSFQRAKSKRLNAFRFVYVPSFQRDLHTGSFKQSALTKMQNRNYQKLVRVRDNAFIVSISIYFETNA